MELDLRHWPGFKLRLPNDYRLVPWSPWLLEKHAAVKYYSFRDEVDAQVFPCFGDYASCRHLMNNIQAKKGFLPEATWLIQFVGEMLPHYTIEHDETIEQDGGQQDGGNESVQQLKEDWLDSEWYDVNEDRDFDAICGPSPPVDYQNSQYCGTIQALLSHRGCASIQNVGVTPSHRGKGLGRALLLASLIGLRRLKIRRVRLEVTAQNERALQLYRCFGFRTVRTLYKTVAVADNESAG